MKDYKDSLTRSFSQYLINHLTLLHITSQIIDTRLKTNIRKGQEPQEKRIVDDEFFRSLRIGISRVKYYQKKMKDIDWVHLDVINDAQKEMDPLFEIVKEHMQTLE